MVFFEKKNQKTFGCLGEGWLLPPGEMVGHVGRDFVWKFGRALFQKGGDAFRGVATGAARAYGAAV